MYALSSPQGEGELSKLEKHLFIYLSMLRYLFTVSKIPVIMLPKAT